MEKNKEKGSVDSRKHSYISWNRNWAVVERHAPLIAKAFLPAFLSMWVWRYVVYGFDFSFDKEAENSLLFILIALSAFTYAIFAGYAINTVLTEYKEISKAVVQDDMETFLVYRDEQLPILFHLLLGTNSLILITSSMFFPFHGTSEGMVINFLVTFILVLIYVVIMELDDYYHSIWFREMIPKEWYQVNAIEYFRNENSKKRKF